jgi:hypothetical protein
MRFRTLLGIAAVLSIAPLVSAQSTRMPLTAGTSLTAPAGDATSIVPTVAKDQTRHLSPREIDILKQLDKTIPSRQRFAACIQWYTCDGMENCQTDQNAVPYSGCLVKGDGHCADCDGCGVDWCACYPESC